MARQFDRFRFIINVARNAKRSQVVAVFLLTCYTLALTLGIAHFGIPFVSHRQPTTRSVSQTDVSSQFEPLSDSGLDLDCEAIYDEIFPEHKIDGRPQNLSTSFFDVLFQQHIGPPELVRVQIAGKDIFPPNDAESQVAAERLAAAIIRKYFYRWRQFLEKSASRRSPCMIKVLSYDCLEGKGKCGGLGDRITGLVSTFYLALGTGRLFHIDWTKNSRLADYFDINEALYNVSAEAYQTHIDLSKSTKYLARQFAFMNRPREEEFVNWASGSKLSEELSVANHAAIKTNSLAGLEGAIKNPAMEAVFRNLFSDFSNDELRNTVDISVIVSAAIRLIFGKPVAKLEKLFNECIGRTDDVNWSKAYRIGVQIRHSEFGGRVSKRQLPCFINFTSEIIRLKTKNGKNGAKVIVFVTGDVGDSIDFIKNQLLISSTKNVRVLTSGEKCPQLKLVHSDYNYSSNWEEMARPYADWLALTRMNHLVISRSGYGETASFLSLAPTQRFEHWNENKNKRSSCNFHNFDQLGFFLRVDETKGEPKKFTN